MKKYLLLALSLVLTACSGGGDVASDMIKKVEEGKTNYVLSYSDDGDSSSYSYIASEEAFDVKKTIKQGSDSITITYKALKAGDEVKDLVVVDQDGNEYETDVDAYAAILKEFVMYELEDNQKTATGIYKNVDSKSTDSSYIYVITNPASVVTIEMAKDASSFLTTFSGIDSTVVKFEFK